MNKHSALGKKILSWRIKLGYKILPPLNWQSKWEPTPPVALLPAPVQSESEVQRRIRIALQKCGPLHPGDFVHAFNATSTAQPIRHTGPIANGATPLSPWQRDWMDNPPQRHTDAISRAEMFADVPVVSGPLEDDGGAPTELHPSTRFRNAMNQLQGL